MRQRYPEYNNRYISDPYPTIGFRAAGKWGRVATRVAILATLFGGGMVGCRQGNEKVFFLE